MNKRALLRLMSMLFAFALVAAACGSSDDDTGTAAEGDTDEAADSGDTGGVDVDAAEDAVTGEGDDEEMDDEEMDDEGPAPENISELEAKWEADRQVIIDELTAAIEAGDYGVGDDNVLRGPAGFEVDLSTCPSDWSDSEGVSDDEILIGHTTAQSGNLAAYGNIAAGMDALFAYINDNGGIDGRKLTMVTKDDAYVATQTIELVDELLQSDKPFYIHTLGSPNSLAVYDTLNEQCVPHPFAQTGHPAWGDPENHPWTTGLQLNYATEAILWGAWIKSNLADQLPVTVGGLVMDNDFGLAYEGGFQAYADANPDVIEDFVAVRHDPAAPTVTNEMTTIAAADPEVFISMTAGNPCLLAVEESARTGLSEAASALFAPSVCKDPNAYMIPAGVAGDDYLIVGGGLKATTDPQYADDPYISWVNETIDAAGLDNTVGLYGTGFTEFGWAHEQTLRIAAALPGGLTRTNFMLAIRSLDLEHPVLLDGLSFASNGNEDAYYIEGSEFSRYDAEAESWIQEGDAIDLNGSSPNCAWGDDGC